MNTKYTKTVGALAAATAMLAGCAVAELEGEIHVGYNSQYIWRGVDLGNDMVEAGADIAYGLGNGFNLSAGAWYASVQDSGLGNFPGFKVPDHYDELDLYGEVSKDFGFATLSVGYIYYSNPQVHVPAIGMNWFGPKFIDDSQEIYFALSRELFWGIKGSLTYYWAIEGENDGYTELGLQKEFEINQCLSADLGVKTGYAIEQGQFSQVTAMAALNWKFSDHATLSPYIAHSWELEALDQTFPGGYNALMTPNGQHNNLFGGVKLTVKF